MNIVTDQDLLDFDFFFGDEGQLSLHTKKIVKTRKAHQCNIELGMKKAHEIPIGDRAIFEKALVDGDFWGSYYFCIPCATKEYSRMMFGDEE